MELVSSKEAKALTVHTYTNTYGHLGVCTLACAHTHKPNWYLQYFQCTPGVFLFFVTKNLRQGGQRVQQVKSTWRTIPKP